VSAVSYSVNMRLATACACVVALEIASAAAHTVDQAAALASTCAARTMYAGAVPITWHVGPDTDRLRLDSWCRAVGPPLAVARPAQTAVTVPPTLEDLVVLTWNAHLAEGQLVDLINSLRSGHLTGGEPVRHFVLLLQELYRRGADVPTFAPDTRSAYAIKPRDPNAPDVRQYSEALGLSLLYVPSMRNGPAVLEDRGNAIVSTEPLEDAFALELPFERQRRVAVGAAIQVRTPQGPLRLHLFDVHLEPLSSPSSLWVFRNPRKRQVNAILDLLRSPRFDDDERSIGVVLGGDFNTIQGGIEEDAYIQARAWSRSLVREDGRSTHRMGRIDYLFFRVDSDWTASTTRVDDKFGSDHHPVLGRFAR
jgi:hypothetical protein